MKYPSIRIEGAIFSPDFLDQIEELSGQGAKDFGFAQGTQVKDEIAQAWADACGYWRTFQRRLDTVREGSNATTETRNLWIVPFLGLLDYEIEFQPRGVVLNKRNYPISHRSTNRAGTPIHIVGARDPAGLDKKPTNATRRMSAHALLQEFLNLRDDLYGLATDGCRLRLLRDSSRLVRQSYLEFDLDRIFNDGLFADFAILFRLLHATRLPPSRDAASDSLIERYHQDSLDSGARIRDGLSGAVKQAILDFGNGFLAHPKNEALLSAINNDDSSEKIYYQQLLRLIYRLLFLIVIEERDLVFPPEADKNKREIYREFYSVSRLRDIAEKRHFVGLRRHDMWLSLRSCFRLFEADGPGHRLGIAPLAGDLFSTEALSWLADCALENDTLLKCISALFLYQHPDSNQIVRVNYAALNVEELGSVYEWLLEYKPEFSTEESRVEFKLIPGKERAVTGSHYTPDDLVQPLIDHSLEHLVEKCLATNNPKAALLDLRVADIACGSGHILLAAARRIATRLAVERTGEEQPSPSAYRTALRDTICTCIYGVDLNPLAVELCKVALWLEAHVPGQPLNFLDHHIKCGNAIVGFARGEELEHGIPTEAFKDRPGDDKKIAAAFRKKNEEDKKSKKQIPIDFDSDLNDRFEQILGEWRTLSDMPEGTPAEIAKKKEQFGDFSHSEHAELLKIIADIPVAQFYIPKVSENVNSLITDSKFHSYWHDDQALEGEEIDAACSVARQERFFHWFMEFPGVIKRGGFDCILGNPPYLGGQALSGTYGHTFCGCMKWLYKPTGLSELVVYFLRRIHGLLKDQGFAAIITTNSIIDGNIRKDGLNQIVGERGDINMAVRSMKWPGAANLYVSLLAFRKGKWAGKKMLNRREVEAINTFFEKGENLEDPKNIIEDRHLMLQGTIFLGEGFLLSHDEAARMCSSDPRNVEIIMPIINGKDINSVPDQSPSRCIINFKDWSLEKAQEYPEPFSIVEEKVKPGRMQQRNKKGQEFWWRFLGSRASLYSRICNLERCFTTARTTKYLNFSEMPVDYVFSDATYVLTTDCWAAYAVVQSTLHEVWARKYSGSLKEHLRYSPSECFDTFAFPDGFWQCPDINLAKIGEEYHEHRKAVMRSLWLGLTKTYNLFHNPDLSPEVVSEIAEKDEKVSAEGYAALLNLRSLHVKLDRAVCDAYGWQDIDLQHGFHDVEILPKEDCRRYTISPEARCEVLERLLKRNLELAKLAKSRYGPSGVRHKRTDNETSKEDDLLSGRFQETE